MLINDTHSSFSSPLHLHHSRESWNMSQAWNDTNTNSDGHRGGLLVLGSITASFGLLAVMYVLAIILAVLL